MSVILRKRKLRTGKYSFVLDISVNNQRWTENLKGLELVPELEISESATAKERKQIERQNKKIQKDNLEAEQTAENCLTLRKSELILSENGLQPKAKNVLFLKQYHNFLNTKSNNSATYKAYEQTLSTFTAYVGKSKIKELTVRQINKDFLQKFLTFLIQRKVSDNSQRLYVNRLRNFFNYLIKDKIISANPISEITLPKFIDKQRDYLDLNEINTMIENRNGISPTAVNMFLFSCFTGLRWSDVLNLKWADIKDGEYFTFRVKKTKKIQTLKLSIPAKQILQSIPKTGENIFNLINSATINYHLRKWSKKSNIGKTVTFHTARHSFAVNYLSAGGDIYILMKLLGHSDLRTTQVYADIIDVRLNEAMNLFKQIEI